jgi:hypothetical protein
VGQVKREESDLGNMGYYFYCINTYIGVWDSGVFFEFVGGQKNGAAKRNGRATQTNDFDLCNREEER